MPPKRFPIRKCEATKSSMNLTGGKINILGCLCWNFIMCWVLCLGRISFHLYKERAIFNGGERWGLEKKVSNGSPPGSTTWVKSPTLRKDHELAHALDQSLVSRCSSVLTDASESKVWNWGAQEGWRSVESFWVGGVGGKWEGLDSLFGRKVWLSQCNSRWKVVDLVWIATDGATGVFQCWALLGDHLHQDLPISYRFQVRLKAVPINNVDRSVGGILSFEVRVFHGYTGGVGLLAMLRKEKKNKHSIIVWCVYIYSAYISITCQQKAQLGSFNMMRKRMLGLACWWAWKFQHFVAGQLNRPESQNCGGFIHNRWRQYPRNSYKHRWLIARMLHFCLT